MNRILSLLTLSALMIMSFTTIATAQKSTDQGKVNFKFSELKGDFDETTLSQAKSMLESSTISLNFEKGKMRVTTTAMNGAIVTNTFIVGDDMTMYIDAMGQKMKIPVSEEERALLAQSEISDDEYDIIYHDEYKNIAGYNCERVTIAPIGEVEGTLLTFYVTDKIKTGSNFIQGLELGNILKDFPLEYTMETNGMHITYTAENVSTSPDEDAFDYDEKGYRIISAEDYVKMMGGGM